MRVLKSILLFTSFNSGSNGNEFAGQMQKDENLHRRDPFNKLVTLNKMMNRLTAYAKGLNPDDSDELMASKHYMTAFRVNNKFFKKNLVGMYHKKDKDGELKCANHSFKAGKKPNGRRRRSDGSGDTVDLTVHADDIENFCSSLEDAHDPEDGTCEDCCSQTRKFGLDLSGHGQDFIKNSRKMFGAVKKWVETHLADCNQKQLRYKRIVNLLAKRLFNGINHELITLDDVRTSRWKRIFPKSHIQDQFLGPDDAPMDKYTLINMVEDRVKREGL